MNGILQELKKPMISPPAPAIAPVKTQAPAARSGLRLRILLALPLSIILALAVHSAFKDVEYPTEASAYSFFLGLLFGLSILAAVIQRYSTPFRKWMENTAPIIAMAVALMAVWQLVTSGYRLFPLPYFPSPPRIIRSLIDDRAMLLDCAWHSFLLLGSGYLLGAAIGLVTGVAIGWFARARYWGMPLLKLLGPIPATAWIPLAMVLAPSTRDSAILIIALAVWFPVTMLTVSGISNTRASYIDVARTLGAGPWFLIFRVAIPAAMPSIFIGLFMGLGTSFLTLIVAETVGVRSGLGWYLAWSQGWGEYGKVYAALVIMAAFFSTIMTLLFKARDSALVWQKGVIKW